MTCQNVWTIASSRSRQHYSTFKRWQEQRTTRQASSKGVPSRFTPIRQLTRQGRLFFGKKRQRLTPLSAADDTRHKGSIHEKEDLFSHLHVNVSDEGYDLYDGLARYFDDVVEFDGVKKSLMRDLQNRCEKVCLRAPR